MILERTRERIAPYAPQIAAALEVDGDAVVLRVEPGELVGSAALLEHVGFDRLEMVTAVDFGDVFELVYLVTSTKLSSTLFVKARLPREQATIESVTGVWPAADWQEREVYDLFGVGFENHPGLKRILLPPEFVGHPLRKDYDDPRIIRRPDYI